MTLAGRAERARVARSFVDGVLGPGHPCGDVATLLVDELFVNSIRHSGSGAPGETVTVAVKTANDVIRVTDPHKWLIHGERLVDDTPHIRVSLADVELPNHVRFTQYVFRMRRCAMTVVLDDAGERVLLMRRHRFIVDRWVWELPGGYVEVAWVPVDETPAMIARGGILGAITIIGVQHAPLRRAAAHVPPL
jgi:hypothetical protein